MEGKVKQYLDEYTGLLYKIEVTDRDGHPLSFAEGVERAITLIRECTTQGGKIVFIGNGGSAAIAGHIALDYWHAGGMRAVAFNDGPQLTCLSNDHGYEQVFAMPIRMFAEPGDVLVAISSSGKSANILKGINTARALGCKMITLSGFAADNPLRHGGDLNFYLPSSAYGFVESGHELILHCILDLSRESKVSNTTRASVDA